MSTPIENVMRSGPVIPVLSIADPDSARAIAEALLEGGLNTVEVTLRTSSALDVIAEMARIQGLTVGAGTVLNERQLDESIQAGAKFIVSPGLSERLGVAAIARGVPFLPGVATASDIMRGLALGLDLFKFFPAEAAGGIRALKALSAPLSQCRFCPTGGITEANAADWLAVESVLCVGGSWLFTDPIDVGELRARAKRAASLGPGIKR